MNTDNLILRETDNLPLINKDDTLTNAEIDGNFINIYNDFISLSQANDPTLMYDVDRSYLVGEFATYDGRMWVAIEVSTGVTPIIGGTDWNDVFPTVLAHEKNKDTILDEGGINETTVAEIRAFIDAGLTSTTNLSLSTKTGTSFKIESSTGTDVTIPQATNIEAGLLNATDKVKLDNTSGINTGDQTLITLNAEDVDNKVTDFTTINDTLYPTTQAVDTYLTAQIPDLVETFLDSNVELNTNKATTFATINDTLYPSVKAVDDQLDLKVDKVVGERLITSSESTLLGNTSGTNTGDQIISDATITTTDITTNNFSTAKHGFVPKGTNVGKYLKDDGTWSTISAGGLTFFTEAQSTASPNATVNVDSLTAVASTTNADFAIVSKGTGALTRQIPDGTVTGGNKRGENAVDLQTLRGSAVQVASGGNSFAGGRYNTASGGDSACFGTSNTASGNLGSFSSGWISTASGQVSVAMGFGNVASGIYSTSFGNSNTSSGQTTFTCNSNNIASGTNSFVAGYNGNDFGIVNRQVFSSTLGVNGDSQKSTLILGKRTTDTTATFLTVQNNAVAANTQLTLQNNNSIRFKGTIIGRQSGSTNTSAWDIDGIIQRGVGAGTTTLLIGNVNVVQNTPAWGTPTLTANTTLGCLTVSVTGALTTNIQWTCIIDTTEVIYL